MEFDYSYFWSAGVFVNLALLFYVLGFLARDEIWLRGLILIGTAFYLIYYYYAADTPLWDAIFASGVLGLANIYMIIVISLERSTVFMSADDLALYQSFGTLNPGQFRLIMKRATREILSDDRVLAREGVVSDHLVFVVDGQFQVQRAAVVADVAPPSFVGEVGFLLERPASATVTARAGTEILQWQARDIRALMARKPELSNAMIALFNLDLAQKVARSMPSGDRAATG